jgi:hypothetical protein
MGVEMVAVAVGYIVVERIPVSRIRVRVAVPVGVVGIDVTNVAVIVAVTIIMG